MELTEFQKVMDAQIEWCKKTLGAKNAEYAQGGDKFHNFKVAARMEDTTQEKTLWGMLIKHWVSVRDMVFNEAPVPLPSYLDEKIGDSINYLLMLRAMFEERRQRDGGVKEYKVWDEKDIHLPAGGYGTVGGVTDGNGRTRSIQDEAQGRPIGKFWSEDARSYIDKQ